MSVEHVHPGPDGDVRLDLEQRFASRAVVQDIVAKMPPAASPSNLLADRQWVRDHASQAVKDKADKVSGATAGDFAGLDGNGNLTDSGKKPSDFATAAQGAKADTAVQSVAVGSSTVKPGEGGALALPVSSSVTSDSEDALATPKAVKTVNDKVTVVEDKIPPQASASNQLADKAFVNSSIATETATFRGTFNLVTDLQLPLDATHEQVAAAVKTKLGQTDYDKNDYVFVQIPQDAEHTDAMKQVDRYKCVETGTDPVVKNWAYEWTLNNSSFTADQWAAINSGITSGLVAKLGDLPTAEALANALAGKLDASNGVATGLVTYLGTINGFDYGLRFGSYGSAYAVQIVARSAGSQSGWQATANLMVQKSKTGYAALLSDIPSVPSASTSTPQMDGAGSAGSSASFARGDHQHPSDASKADKSEVAPLQFAAWYPDGSVKSEADFTQGIKFSYDASTLTASVLPFCNTGNPDADNSRLSGRVVIPPYVEREGVRFTVTSVSGTLSSPGVGPGPAAVVAPTTVERLDTGALFGCKALASASFHGVTTVAGSVFYGCESLVSVSLPVAETVGHAAFNGCSSLKSLVLPGATDIKTALSNAGAIESVLLPSIARIEAGAFSGDRNLEAVDFGGTPRSSVPPLGSGAFYNVPTTCKIIVPDAQYDAWTAASGWSGLVAQGYTFLKHSEWEPPHRYELDRAKLVYAECTTDQGVAAKAATTPGGDFVAEEGRVVLVRFAHFCAGGNPTLSIDGSTSMPIYQRLEGSAKYPAGEWAWGEGDTIQLRLFSWGWLMLGPVPAGPNQLGVVRLRNGLDHNDSRATVDQPTLKAAFDGKLDSAATGFVEFDATRTYVAGATVTYKGRAYICTTNRAPGAWNPDHFNEMPVVVNRTTATGGVAVGEGAKATNDGTAAGRGAEANATGSVATGAGAFVSNTSDKGIAVGPDAKVYAQYGTAVGHGAEVSAEKAAAFGYNAKVAASKTGAVQLGAGTNQQAYSLQFRSTTVVNTDGKIPAANLDNSFTIAGDAAYKTWEISGGTGDDGHGGDNQAIYSRGTYTYDAASGTWVCSASRLIRRKAGTANTFQLVADPGAQNEGVMKEFDGFGQHTVDMNYAGYQSTGVSIASSAPDTLARDSDVKNNAGAIEYLRHIFSGQQLPQNPTQDRVAEVVKTIFAQLGGTIQ